MSDSNENDHKSTTQNTDTPALDADYQAWRAKQPEPKGLHDQVRFYLEQGWRPFPIQPRSKEPLGGINWKTFEVTAESIAAHFVDGRNVAVQLGEVSGNLIDIDLDCPFARQLAPYFLQPTVTFGRAGSPKSHWLYVLSDEKPDRATVKFNGDPQGDMRGMIVEVRGDGSYTVFPGSVHPSGEPIEFDRPGSPCRIERAALLDAVSLLAAAALLVRLWPTGAGIRDELAMAVAGMLLRRGFTVEQTQQVIEVVAQHAGDEEWRARGKKAEPTKRKLDNGKRVTGVKRLAELLGDEKHARLIYAWMDGDQTGKAVAFDELDQKHFVANMGGKTIVFNEEINPKNKRRSYSVSNFTDFKNRYINRCVEVKGKPVNVAKAWLEEPSRITYKGVVIDPKDEHPGYFNMWCGFGVESIDKEGGWSRLQDHILQIICDGDQDAYEQLLNWMAWAVQNPDRPAEKAVVILGKKGTGKGVLCRAMAFIFGQHGLQVTNPKHLMGQFNMPLLDCCLLYADEVYVSDDRAARKVLQGYITEPEFMCEPKGVNAFRASNMLHIMMTTNERNAVDATTDERRYFVLKARDDRMGDHAYFNELNAQLEDGGYQAMRYDLQNRPLAGWHPRQMKRTGALADQIRRNMGSVGQWWDHALVTGQLLRDDVRDVNSAWEREAVNVPRAELYASFKVFAKESGLDDRITQMAFFGELRELLPEGRMDLKSRGAMNYRTGRLEKYGGKDRVMVCGLPSLLVCRAHYEAKIGHPLECIQDEEARPGDTEPEEGLF